jgi:hypothetical protein
MYMMSSCCLIAMHDASKEAFWAVNTSSEPAGRGNAPNPTPVTETIISCKYKDVSLGQMMM